MHTEQLVGFRTKDGKLSLMLRITPHNRSSCTQAVICNLHIQKIMADRSYIVLTISYSFQKIPNYSYFSFITAVDALLSSNRLHVVAQIESGVNSDETLVLLFVSLFMMVSRHGSLLDVVIL